MALFDFHITHTPIGPIAQSLTHTNSGASVYQMWISQRCKWRNCQSQESPWVEISRSHLKARDRKKQRGRERESRRLTAGYAGSAAKVQRKRKSKKRERKPPAEKRGKAFHLRIYLEFENLMRWADGQIMLCKWYVHKSQTDSATHAHWQPGVLLLLPLPRLVLVAAQDSLHKKQRREWLTAFTCETS